MVTDEITAETFQRFVVEQAAMGIDDVNYSFVGLAGETGELLEWHKKVNLRTTNHRTDQALPTKNELLSECGDVLHYLVRILTFYGYTLDDAMRYNVEKINNRVALRSGLPRPAMLEEEHV